jgi:hypothetical protein
MAKEQYTEFQKDIIMGMRFILGTLGGILGLLIGIWIGIGIS